jgi:glycerol-3-phosphate O-acyltransferase
MVAPEPTSNSPAADDESVGQTHKRYGGLLRRLFELFFGPIHYPEKRAHRIRELAGHGVIIYVARARSPWLAVYFNSALARMGLPLAGFVGGIKLWPWQPIGRLWRKARRNVTELVGTWRARYGEAFPSRREEVLVETVFRGEAALLSLQDRRRSFRRKLRKPAVNDYLRALVAAQRTSDRPIFIVPHAITSLAHGGEARETLAERLFGTRPRRRQRRPLGLSMALTARVARRSTVRVGDAVDLAALVAKHNDLSDAKITRRLRHLLDRRIREEERVIAGPQMPSYRTLHRHILRDPVLKAVIEKLAAEQDKPVEVVEKKAGKYLREIAARYSPALAGTFATLMNWVFTRIYDGVVIDEPGLAQVLDTARRGPVVYCPSHRSHVDYLVLSTILWTHGFTPPHIAAGANLSFFPMGYVFRHSGAFFLRRTFGGNHLYASVFRAYLAELLRHGTGLEFFIEGTRSRTGKVLMPRLGLLSMAIDAWRQGAREDVFFAPVSIDYEQIIEAGAYERELRGGEKKREDVRGVLRSAKVLRSRYGRAHLQFAPPLSLAAIAAARGLPQDPSPEYNEAWRAETARIGHRILHQVAISSSVTPTAVAATVLLAHRGRGIAHGRLLDRAHELIDYLDTALARLSAALAEPDTRAGAVLEAVQSLVDRGAVAVDRPGRADSEPIYRVIEERRIQLDYYKNSIMSTMAPATLPCRALARRTSDSNGVAAYEDVRRDTEFVSRLLKRELLYRADDTFTTYFDEALASLGARGFIDVHEDGRIELRDSEAVLQLAGLLDSLVQAYWVTAATVHELRKFPMWHKELATRALERARRGFLEGQLSRPEAANRNTIENALDWMIASGMLEVDRSTKRKPVRIADGFSEEELNRLVNDIAAFL